MLDKTGMRCSIRGGGHLGKLQLVAVGPTNDKGQLRVMEFLIQEEALV